jgi:hypothetical protein
VTNPVARKGGAMRRAASPNTTTLAIAICTAFEATAPRMETPTAEPAESPSRDPHREGGRQGAREREQRDVGKERARDDAHTEDFYEGQGEVPGQGQEIGREEYGKVGYAEAHEGEGLGHHVFDRREEEAEGSEEGCHVRRAPGRPFGRLSRRSHRRLHRPSLRLP